jgi:hypothetical protein
MIGALALLLALASAPKNEGHQAHKTDERTAADQRGTAKSPVVVKVIPAEPDTAETGRQSQERQQHAKNESRLAWSSIWLAISTFLLVGVTLGLAVFTYRLWKTTSEMVSKSDAAAAANAERMEQSIELSAKAATAMSVSADATEAMFYATHPPEMIVDDVHFIKGTETIAYSVENAGGSDATILESNASRRLHLVGQAPPRPLPYSSDRNTLGHTSYDLGVRIEHECPEPDPESLDVTFAQIEPKTACIALFGFIHYQGHNGKRFTNTFYRVSDPKTGYFSVLDSSYERTH